MKDITQITNIFKEVFGSENGQAVLKYLEDCYGVNNSIFSKDALELAYREGSRNVVLTIKALVNFTEQEGGEYEYGT